jgi:hypothetical protein
MVSVVLLGDALADGDALDLVEPFALEDGRLSGVSLRKCFILFFREVLVEGHDCWRSNCAQTAGNGSPPGKEVGGEMPMLELD